MSPTTKTFEVMVKTKTELYRSNKRLGRGRPTTPSPVVVGIVIIIRNDYGLLTQGI